MNDLSIRKALATLIANSDMTDLTNLYRVLFRMFLAVVMIMGGGWFLWTAAFWPAGETTEITTMIVGFVIGTFLALPIGFYFGGQDRQKKNDEQEVLK